MTASLCRCDAEYRETDDPALPPHVYIHVCKDCGYWAEYDSQLDEYR